MQKQADGFNLNATVCLQTGYILLAHVIIIIIIIIIITIRVALAELNPWLSSLPDLSSCQELTGA